MRKSILFILIFIVGCISTSQQENRETFWNSVFEYFETKHFAIPIPPLPNEKANARELVYRTLCTSVVIDIVKENTELSSSSLKEVNSFFKENMYENIKGKKISSTEFNFLDIPISFENFDTLSREDKFFTRKNQCGIRLTPPIIKNNKAILKYSLLYTPKSGEGFLLFLSYDRVKEKWIIFKEKSLFII